MYFLKNFSGGFRYVRINAGATGEVMCGSTGLWRKQNEHFLRTECILVGGKKSCQTEITQDNFPISIDEVVSKGDVAMNCLRQGLQS